MQDRSLSLQDPEALYETKFNKARTFPSRSAFSHPGAPSNNAPLFASCLAQLCRQERKQKRGIREVNSLGFKTTRKKRNNSILGRDHLEQQGSMPWLPHSRVTARDRQHVAILKVAALVRFIKCG